jgi:purine-binding chemotaxis protein CheW
MSTPLVESWLDDLLVPDTTPASAGSARPAAAPPMSAPPPASVERAHKPPPSGRRASERLSRWLCVSVDGDLYAFVLLRVQEVVRMQPVVAMRGADPAVLGVMNLRGRVVPVLDVGRWLGGAPVSAGEAARVVIVERDDELIGVLVSAVHEVATLSDDRIEPPLPGTDPGPILGIGRHNGRPVVLLEADALFA